MSNLNELEIEILREVKNGKDRFVYKHNQDAKMILEALKKLQLEGYIDSMGIQSKDGRGYTHVKLKDKAKTIDL